MPSHRWLLLLPATNRTVEDDFAALLTEFEFAVTRLSALVGPTVSVEAYADIVVDAASGSGGDVGGIALGYASGSYRGGRTGEKALCDRVTAAAALDFLTSAHAAAEKAASRGHHPGRGRLAVPGRNERGYRSLPGRMGTRRRRGARRADGTSR